ncbi:MAG: hypothetical protein BWY15_00336 [Firmicutes bacterium ADurb.Bin193]|nr:MAG: hypothetical protein BWY15_00336 [Firmicutes bacterium ADurb.Bin193]
MTKRVVITTTIFSLIVVSLVFVAATAPIGSAEKAAAFVQSLGWIIDEKPIESAFVDIPKVFDSVYENYNALQKEAGFDLSEYRGKRVMRYTFAVKNFDGEENVRANVLTYRGKIIGGDLMTVAIDGFMIPLKKR